MHALFAANAEFSEFAKDAGFAINARSAKEAATKEECADFESGLDTPAWDESKAVPFATNATNAKYAEYAEYAENAEKAALAKNAFVAENARDATVGTKVLFAHYAVKAGSACHVDATLGDKEEKD